MLNFFGLLNLNYLWHMELRKSYLLQINRCIIFLMVVLMLGSCSRKDLIPASDFYIDLNNGNVTNSQGGYQDNIPDFTNLYLTGGYVYIYGIIVFKGLDQSYYALSQYHSTDGCDVEYQVSYDELVCPCDQVHFNKFGQETFGNGTTYLLPYATSLSNSILHIYTP